MSENKLQDVKDAEGYIDHTLKRLQKSFRVTTIATIVILALETIYFVVLTDAIGSGLKAMSVVHVEQYKDEIDEYLFNPAKKSLADIKSHPGDVPRSLEIMFHHLPEKAIVGKYSNVVEKAAVYLGKGNDWIGNKKNYTNHVAKAQKALVDFNKRTSKLNDEELAKAKQILRVFNEEVKYSPEKFEQFKEMIGRINEPEDIEGMANLISQKIVGEMDAQGYMLTTSATDFLKQNIDELPEWVKNQIPKYGAQFRHETDSWINYYCKSVSDGLGSTFDTFLDDNADKIKEFSKRTDDEETLNKLDEAMTEELVKFMETTSIENYGTLKDQSDRFLKRLEAANKLLLPLATKKTEDLSNHELRLRSAIALFMVEVKKRN